MRGYHFDRSKLGQLSQGTKIPLTHGQISYETEHLYKKILQRAPKEMFRVE